MAVDEEAFLREIFERWNRGDFELDEFRDRIDPEVVIDSSLTGAEWHGYEGVRGWLAEIAEQFENWTLVMKEVREQRARRVADRRRDRGARAPQRRRPRDAGGLGGALPRRPRSTGGAAS